MEVSSSGDFNVGSNRQNLASSSLHHPDLLHGGARAIIQEDDYPLTCQKVRTQTYTPPRQHKHSVGKSSDDLVPLNQQVSAAAAGFNKKIGSNCHQQQGSPHSLITAKELNSCILASEFTRAVCSVLVAILVLISYIEYPLMGINSVISKSVVAAKPLYIILLTDISVVFAHAVMRKRISGDLEEEDSDGGREGKGMSEEGLNWARAVMVLERGLVLHQTIRALFIDCSVYMVVVGCGLSLI